MFENIGIFDINVFETAGHNELSRAMIELNHSNLDFNSPEALCIVIENYVGCVAMTQRKEAYGGEPAFQFSYTFSNRENVPAFALEGNSLLVFGVLLEYFEHYCHQSASSVAAINRLKTRVMETLESEDETLIEFDTQICYRITSRDAYSYSIVVFENCSGEPSDPFGGGSVWSLGIHVQLS